MTPLFSTAYLPPVPYVATLLQHTAQHPEALVEAHETYPKQTYRNRALILTAGGVRPLTVPVVRTQGNHSRTCDIAIDYHTRWNVVHLRTLDAAYAASPYYMYYRDGLHAALMQRYDRLLDLNQALLAWLQKCMKINVKIELTTDWLPFGPAGAPAHPYDYRNAFSPKTTAHHPPPTAHRPPSTAHCPLTTSHFPLPTAHYKPYYQVFSDRHPFTPGLSIVDLLFNLGPEALGYLRQPLV